MSSYNPSGGNRLKPWKARVSRNDVQYYLGRYTTREEAELVEQAYKILQGWTERLPAIEHERYTHSDWVLVSPKRPRTGLVPKEKVGPA